MSVAIEGVQKILQNLDLAGRRSRGAVAAALYQEGLAIMAESVKQVPVDTGRLRSTHYVSPPTGDKDDPVCTLGYGTNYGVYVHERPELKHTSGKAKFLEDPINSARSGYVERVAARAHENFERGIGVSTIPKTAPTHSKKAG